MLIDKCPHCNASHVQTEQRFTEGLSPRASSTWWALLRCQNPQCQRLVLAEITERGEVRILYPIGQFDLDATVPVSQEIRDDFREAGLALGAGCYKASMVMSRRVLQRCLKEQGCTQRNLVDAINHALQQSILRKSFHGVAEEIREYGNLGAHPDDDQLSNAIRENAQQILDFARLFIHEFYEVPAAAARLKQSRQTPNP
jgi:hypothetical protein